VQRHGRYDRLDRDDQHDRRARHDQHSEHDRHDRHRCRSSGPSSGSAMLTARTVAIHHVRAAVRGADRAGFDVVPLLERSGIAPSLLEVERARVSADQFARLVKGLWTVLDDEFIGFGPARSKVGTFAMMCHATVHCSKDLAGALRRAAEFYALFPSGPDFRIISGGGGVGGGTGGEGPENEARIEFHSPAATATGPAARNHAGHVDRPDDLDDERDSDDPDHFRAETLLIVAHRFSGWLIRRRIPLRRVELAYPAPPHVLEYDLLFGAPCVFDAPTTALVFDAALLSEPVLQDEAGIAAFLRRAPQDVLSRIDYGSTTAARVRRLVGQSLPGTLPAEAEVAERLSVSPQTLRRQLAAEGSSFQHIRDQMRRDHAIAALAEGRTPIERISEQLGFSEPSAFHRAFKRWTGATPRAYQPGASVDPPDSDDDDDDG
jgi:AraC-like DNA-binding protein